MQCSVFKQIGGFIPILIWLVLLLVVQARADSFSDAERLYRTGVLPSGKPLQGKRDIGVPVSGSEAACINCHRRSGFGELEGQILIPPVTAKYLFRVNGSHGLEDMDYRFGTGINRQRKPYNKSTLARAIREGIGKEGQKLSPLMPRYSIDDSSMESLVAYLTALSDRDAPGVSRDTLHFATIITPDADPIKSKGMLDVLNQFFEDKNEFLRGGRRIVQSSVHVKYRVTRSWELHVWRLTGEASGWENQLRGYLAEQPVFAVISGMGGKTWAPIHHFCEAESIPCILPNVELPVDRENDYYSIYFNKGVLLEAGLIANAIQDHADDFPYKRIVQVYRAGDIGKAGSEELDKLLQVSGVNQIHQVLKRPTSSAKELAKIMGELKSDDALILWLRPDDLRSLPAKLRSGKNVYVSGLMGGLENTPLPVEWRHIAHMAYPMDLPDLRRARMNFPLGWMRIRNIPVVDELTQANTYLACGILAENVTQMLDSFVRDYMIERIESMVSYRTVTGFYPRLGLGPGQRFVSKGGYIVHFADDQGAKLIADSEWVNP